MSFTSISFALFLPAVLLFCHVTPGPWHWLVLLAASYSFYAASGSPLLLPVLAFVTITTFAVGCRIGMEERECRRRLLMLGGCGVNILVLVACKFLPVLGDDAAGSLPHPFVAVGVSFYTVQAISYLVDVHLGVTPPERHVGMFALYLSFFPKVLLGPIERAGELLPRLRQPWSYDYGMIRSGLVLFAIGLFKKVVLADRLGKFVDLVFNDVQAFTGVPLLMACYGFAFQIFFDFSGYTDMALGVARMLNISLTANFHRPYLATSVAQFWQRWHISFSRWLLDYVFTPLQMWFRRAGIPGTVAALLVTFVVSGLWHGSSMCFIAWGVLHGVYLSCSVIGKPYRTRISTLLRIEGSSIQTVWRTTVTFHLVCLSWVFFRAASVSDAFYVVTHLFTGLGTVLTGFDSVMSALHTTLPGLRKSDSLVLLALTALSVAIFHLPSQREPSDTLVQQPAWIRWPVYYLIIITILIFGDFKKSEFIYFGF